MLTEATALISSAKVAIDIAKGINSLKSDVQRSEAIAKILDTLITVQQLFQCKRSSTIS